MPPVRTALQPHLDLAGVLGGKAVIADLPGEVHHRARPQAAV